MQGYKIDSFTCQISIYMELLLVSNSRVGKHKMGAQNQFPINFKNVIWKTTQVKELYDLKITAHQKENKIIPPQKSASKLGENCDKTVFISIPRIIMQ